MDFGAALHHAGFMNPAPSEEAGQTARSLIDALKANPMTLALVVFNVIFIGAVYFGTRDQRASQGEIIKMLLENQQKTSEMLQQCVPNPPRFPQQ
jgi:hypothetical protein